ncbi:4'-phosphopantetheinyl transferase family protein [Janthinobacterium sp.]|uniref:4'-phosphopantetheinyl transferase family protein n=1 Tax=Janthinobacterium sp. TaxID=1871054 RepID=UPI00293D2D01|nr:4'-phosphopantetheinyl transferase superfamily protein [Janthinobacterium sp.]
MAAHAAVWLLDGRSVADAQLAPYAAWLGREEALRYARFLRPLRQRQFLIGRALLRLALGELLGVPAAGVRLRERPGQAPALDFPGAAPGFSLSHSGPWVACAVSAETALGLDIEVLDATRDLAALAEQAFEPAVAAALAQLPAQARAAAFYREWSAQEARYKLGACAAPACLSLPHAELSIALCSARPLAAPPALLMRRLDGDA